MDEQTKKIKKERSSNKVNKQIGDYVLKHTIGKGTFGKVKLGYHVPTEENVAIKILEKNKITDKDDMIRIEREIKISKSLNHLNIVKIFEILEDAENYYIIMEHAKGGELFNYILNKRRLSEQESSYFFYQIINGMEHMHKNNVVHRDLKPENLLLTEEKIIKIIDFGLSNEFAVGNLLQTPCGSPCYAAPEMVLGKRYSGAKIDIWSCGIILYAMTCGYLPFEDKKNEILFRKIIDCDYELPGFLTGNVKDLIKKILVTNPRNRATIEDIKKHNFYKQGKSIFKKERKFFDFDNEIKGNLEVEKIINERLVFEFKEKLKEKLTIEDVESIKKLAATKGINKKDDCNLRENDSDFLCNYNQETLEEDKSFSKKMIIFEENKNEFDRNTSESEDNDTFELNKETKIFNKASNKDIQIKEKIDLSKFNVSYEILYNNLLKDKQFLNSLIAKLPAADDKENNNDDRESRRSKSITNHQFCFGQPKINGNFNCIKKVENLNVNIAPLVSISSLPYSRKDSKSKKNFNKIKSKGENKGVNYTKNYNLIANSTENKNKFTTKSIKKELIKTKNFSLNSKNYVNNLELNLNLIDNADKQEKNENINHGNFITIDANTILNKVNQNLSNNIENNNILTCNKLKKQTTNKENSNNKNPGNLNTFDSKSLFNKFQESKVNYSNKSNNKNVSTLKKNIDLDTIIQFSTNNANDPNINPFVNIAKDNYTKKNTESLNINLIPNSARNIVKHETIDSLDMSNLNSTANKNLKAFNILNERRNESLRLGTPKNTDLANYLFNKGHTKEKNYNRGSINNSNNRTIDINANYKNMFLNNKKENVKVYNTESNNFNFQKLTETFNNQNKITNTISTTTNYATIGPEKKIITKTSLLNNENKETVNFKMNNLKEKYSNENYLVSNTPNNKKDIEIGANPQTKKTESMKITEIQVVSNTTKQSSNLKNNKIPSKNRNSVTSSDRIFVDLFSSINKKTQYIEKSIKPSSHTNSLCIGNYNAKDFSTLILKTNSNKYTNDFLSTTFKKETIDVNKEINKNIKTIQSEFDLKAAEIIGVESKVKRLRRMIKDSLGNSNYASDISALQKLESPKANKAKIILTSDYEENKLKIPLKQSKTICTDNGYEINFIDKIKGNLSSRINGGKKICSVQADWRPPSKPKGRNEKNYQVIPIAQNNMKFKEYNDKASRVHKDFETLYKKVIDNKKQKYDINYRSTNSNKINCEESMNHQKIRKTANYNTNDIKSLINTIDVDLNEIKTRASSKRSSETYSKFNSKTKINKEKMLNKYVTLDLFDVNDNSKKNGQLDKTRNQSSEAKIYQNSFKPMLNIDKNSVNGYANDGKLGGSVNNFIKFSLFSNSASNTKINLSSIPIFKKYE